MLVAMLESIEGGLGRQSGNGRKVGNDSGPFPNLCLDVGCFLGDGPDETAQITGAGSYLEAEVAKACLSVLNHCGFHDQV